MTEDDIYGLDKTTGKISKVKEKRFKFFGFFGRKPVIESAISSGEKLNDEGLQVKVKEKVEITYKKIEDKDINELRKEMRKRIGESYGIDPIKENDNPLVDFIEKQNKTFDKAKETFDDDIYGEHRNGAGLWTSIAFGCSIKNCKEYVSDSSDEEVWGTCFQILYNTRSLRRLLTYNPFRIYRILKYYWHRKSILDVNKVDNFSMCSKHYIEFCRENDINIILDNKGMILNPRKNRFKHKCVIPECKHTFKYLILKDSVSICREHYRTMVLLTYEFKKSMFDEVMDDIEKKIDEENE